jgi:arginase family enzyme
VPAVEAPVVADGEEAPATPAPPVRGMTTEQIRRVGNRIAEHERDLKNSTSRR